MYDPLPVHCQVDIFDREAVFIERCLKPVIKDFPKLKVVMEHITTKVSYICGPAGLWAYMSLPWIFFCNDSKPQSSSRLVMIMSLLRSQLITFFTIAIAFFKEVRDSFVLQTSCMCRFQAGTHDMNCVGFDSRSQSSLLLSADFEV